MEALDTDLVKLLERQLPEFVCMPHKHSINETTRSVQYEISLTEPRSATVIQFSPR